MHSMHEDDNHHSLLEHARFVFESWIRLPDVVPVLLYCAGLLREEVSEEEISCFAKRLARPIPHPSPRLNHGGLS